MTGRRVWWYFVAFFGFILLVNGLMITFALRTHSGLVTEYPYEKGLAYNQVVKAEEAQEKLGWKGHIDYADDSIRFMLKDQTGHLIKPDKATASFSRPTQEGLDFTVQLTDTDTPVIFPAKGLWVVRIDAVHGGTHYQQSKRLIVE